jgi:hypothetical protein
MFIKTCEEQLSLCEDFADEQAKVIHASGYLKGQALVLWNVREPSKKLTWNYFKSFLINNYTPPDMIENLKEKLKELKHTNSVMNYYIDFMAIARQLTDKDLAKIDKEKLFLEGLNHDAKIAVKQAMNNTLLNKRFGQRENEDDDDYDVVCIEQTVKQKLSIREMYTIAINFEAESRQSRNTNQLAIAYNSSSNNRAQHSNKESNNIIPTCCICNKKGHIGENCKINPENTLITCSYCQRKGHKADTCFRNPEYKDKIPVCNFCKTKGHLEAVCRTKKLQTSKVMMCKTTNMQCRMKKGGLIRTPGKLDGIETILLIDSGAETSLISKRLVEELKIPILGADIELEGSTGKARAIGITRLIEVDINGYKHKTAFIVQNLHHIDVALGMDWIGQQNILIDTKNKLLIDKNLNVVIAENEVYEDDLDDYLSFNAIELNKLRNFISSHRKRERTSDPNQRRTRRIG